MHFYKALPNADCMNRSQWRYHICSYGKQELKKSYVTGIRTGIMPNKSLKCLLTITGSISLLVESKSVCRWSFYTPIIYVTTRHPSDILWHLKINMYLEHWMSCKICCITFFTYCSTKNHPTQSWWMNFFSLCTPSLS